MKKLFYLPLLLGLLASCTDSPTSPKSPTGSDAYTLTVSFSPSSKTAYTLLSSPATDANLIAVTAVIKKNSAVPSDRIQTTFQVDGGPLISESGAATWNAIAVNGTVTAHLYSPVSGSFKVKVWITVAGLSNPPSQEAIVQFVQDAYTLTASFSPSSQTAYILTNGPAAGANLITVTAVIRKNNAVPTDAIQTTFQVDGGPLISESVASSWNTTAVNGTVTAHLYSTVGGMFHLKIGIVVTGYANPPTLDAVVQFVKDPHVSVTSITPGSGSIAGGDTVLITGSGFVQPLQVYFGTQPAVFISGDFNTLNVKTPAHFPSSCNANDVVDVKVVINPGQTTEQSSSLPSAFTYLSQSLIPTITALSPSNGTDLGGTSVTIYGTNFYCGLGVLVYFNGVPTRIQQCSGTQIVVISPSAQAVGVGDCTAIDVKVQNVCGGQSALLTGGYKYGPDVQPPTITAVSPNHGTDQGGTQVTIYGSNFYCGDGVLVYFNTVPARIQQCSATQMVVTSPSARDVGVGNCNAAVDIKVLNICGGLAATLPGGYKYGPNIQITSNGPTEGLFTGGTTVTIYGQGFNAPVSVALAGVAGGVLNVSDSEIVVKSGYYDPLLSCADHQGSVDVTDIDCGAAATGGTWKYKVPKLYTSSIVDTTSGKGNEGKTGDSVTITGAFFYPPVSVTFGTTNGVVTSVSPDLTTIVVTVPQYTGTYLTQACAISGCPGAQNLPTPVPVTVTSLVTGCVSVFNSFFYDPADASCHLTAPTCSQFVATGIGSANCTLTFSAATSVCGDTPAYAWTAPAGCSPTSGSGSIFTCTVASGSSGTFTATFNATISAGTAPGCGVSATLTATQCP